MKYSEPQLIDLMKRMIAIYLEGYPDDAEELKRFQRWVLEQWGYTDGNP
jgi:hypothetical protein